MAVHGVVGERPRVGLVVADDERRVGAQRRDQRHGEARIACPTGCPRATGAARPRQTGVKLCIEKIAGDVAGGDARARSPRRSRRDRARESERCAAPAPRHRRGVARHRRAVGEAHDQRRIVLAAVGVDEEARERREHRRRAKARGKRARHRRGAGVVGDVAGKLRRRQSKVAVLRRQAVVGVIADEQQPAAGIAFDEGERRRNPRGGSFIGGGIMRGTGDGHTEKQLAARQALCSRAPGHDPAVFCPDSLRPRHSVLRAVRRIVDRASVHAP